MVPFPVIKLGYLAIRQISKPISNRIKQFSISNHTFRRYICIPAAQLYHRLETNAKLVLLGFAKPQKVTPLTEDMAVQLGADIIGEVFVFGTAATIMIIEYTASAASAAAKAQELEDRLCRLEARSQDLGLTVHHQKHMIAALTRDLEYSNSTVGRIKTLVGLKSTPTIDEISKEAETTSLITQPLPDVTTSLNPEVPGLHRSQSEPTIPTESHVSKTKTLSFLFRGISQAIEALGMDAEDIYDIEENDDD